MAESVTLPHLMSEHGLESTPEIDEVFALATQVTLARGKGENHASRRSIVFAISRVNKEAGRWFGQLDVDFEKTLQLKDGYGSSSASKSPASSINPAIGHGLVDYKGTWPGRPLDSWGLLWSVLINDLGHFETLFKSSQTSPEAFVRRVELRLSGLYAFQLAGHSNQTLLSSFNPPPELGSFRLSKRTGALFERAIALARQTNARLPVGEDLLFLTALEQGGELKPQYALGFLRKTVEEQLGEDNARAAISEAGRIWPSEIESRGQRYVHRDLDPKTALLTESVRSVLLSAKSLASGAQPKEGGFISGRHFLGALLSHATEREPGGPSRLSLLVSERFPGLDIAGLKRELLTGFLEKMAPEVDREDLLEPWRELLGLSASEEAPKPPKPPDPPTDLTVSPKQIAYNGENLDGKDLLGLDREISALAELIADKKVKPPLSIGLFGDWGSGKSFFMRRVRDRLQELTEIKKWKGERPYFEHIVSVEFNAWHYAEAQLWPSLVSHIFETLNTYCLGDKTEDRRKEQKKWENLLKQIEEASQLRELANEKLRLAEERRQEAKGKLSDARSKVEDLVRRLEQAFHKEVKTSSELKPVAKILNSGQWAALKMELKANQGHLQELIRRAVNLPRLFVAELGSGRKQLRLLALAVGVFLAILALNVGLPWLLSSPADGEATEKLVTGPIGELFATLSAGALWARQALSSANRSVAAFESFLEGADKGEAAVEQKAIAKAEKEVSKAEELVRKLELEKETVHPGRRLERFLKDRANSDQYRKHLGLPSIIREDFESLSRILRGQSAALTGLDLCATPTVEAVKTALLKALENSDSAIDGVDVVCESEPAGARQEGVWRLEDRATNRTFTIEKSGGSWIARIRYSNVPEIDRIVLYIDDLDRCSAKLVVEVLQAVHLLLAFPLFIVVVGVDARWVSRSLRHRYEDFWKNNDDLSQEGVELGHAATPQDYLEKIFQIPFWLKGMEKTATADYIEALVRDENEVEESAEGASDDSDDRDTQDPPVPAGAEPNRETPEESPVTVVAEQQRPAERESVPQAPDEQAAAEPEGIEPNSKPSGDEEEAAEIPREQKLKRHELDFMKTLAPILKRSPRSAKRFLNTYRLVRRMVPDSRIKAWVDPETGAYRAVQVLLALITGLPGIARLLLNLLEEDGGKARDLSAFLGSVTIAEATPRQLKELGRLKELIEKLSALPLGEEHRERLKLIRLIRRFSFSVGAT